MGKIKFQNQLPKYEMCMMDSSIFKENIYQILFSGIEHQKFYYVQLITIHQLTSGLLDALPASFTQKGPYFQVLAPFFKLSISTYFVQKRIKILHQ